MGNLQNFMTALEAAWTGASAPSDGSSLAYRFVDSFDEERGFGQHRECVWQRPESGTITGESPIEIEWVIDCDVAIHRRDRTQAAYHRALEDEAKVLFKAYEAVTSWGSGVLEAHLEGVDMSDERRDNARRATGVRQPLVTRQVYTFRVLVQEA